MLYRYSSHAETSLRLGLAFAVVSSPEANATNWAATGGKSSPHFPNLTQRGFGTRFWRDEDRRLVHELLQSGFNDSPVIDYDKVLFWGGSAGTVFLHRFIEQYAGVYGGGFYAWCGSPTQGRRRWYRPPPRVTDDWVPTFPWGPESTAPVRERFRVFVQITTGDFVYDTGAPLAHYYGDVLGLDTRADLDAPGGHCQPGRTPTHEVLAWLLGDSHDQASVPAGQDSDTDRDGIPNLIDDDDDNDGAWDVVDALPLDPRDWRDTDGDGIGDFADQDADGDGIENHEDRFPLNASEWKDTDGDGIGDNLDRDDDNDGLPDSGDSQPSEGVTGEVVSFSMFRDGGSLANVRALVHTGKPADFVYPEARGDRQAYQFLRLGNATNSTYQIMIDRTTRRRRCRALLFPQLCEDPPSSFAYFEHYVDQIYVDRNQNGDLTDDGPPLLLARNREDPHTVPSTRAIVEVSYSSGHRLPYAVRFWTSERLDDGVRYSATSGWSGLVRPPAGDPVLVGVVDVNSDGVFEPIHTRDFACVDTNRNAHLEECAPVDGRYPRPIGRDGSFELDGQARRLVVAPSGHIIEIRSGR